MEDISTFQNGKYWRVAAAKEEKDAVGLYYFNEDGLQHLPTDRVEPRKSQYCPRTLEEFELLRSFDFNTLIDMGCRIWTRTHYVTIWLFPIEWYDTLVDGMAVMTLNGEIKAFNKEEFPRDSRLGVLCFGFYQALN